MRLSGGPLCIDSSSAMIALALQLLFCFEVGALSGSLVSPAPE
jgi:hypothetical protein